MVRIRPALNNDLDFLWTMLFYASKANEQPTATLDSIRHDPGLRRYLSAWGRPGDAGVIAYDQESRVGAAWLRLFTADNTDLATFAGAEVPELAIAVEPGKVGAGIGSMLLDKLLHDADLSGIPAIVLSARADNPAVRLYQRFGFVETDRIVNRIGTTSIKMIRTS